jgi:hypothetical protein
VVTRRAPACGISRLRLMMDHLAKGLGECAALSANYRWNVAFPALAVIVHRTTEQVENKKPGNSESLPCVSSAERSTTSRIRPACSEERLRC